MKKCITLLFFVWAMLKCARMNTPISELTCDRNHLIQEWNHEERVPTANKAYWNIAQKFTELQGIVIKKASEKLVGKKHITLMEYIKLGLFRKQNFIFTSAALIYVGLLIETIFNFLRNRKKFHMNIMPYRGFYFKNGLILIYFIIIGIIVYYLSETMDFVSNYRLAYDQRKLRFRKFIKEYNRSIDLSHRQFICYPHQTSSKTEEIFSFYKSVEKCYSENSEVQDALTKLIDVIEKKCNSTLLQCGAPGKIMTNVSFLSSDHYHNISNTIYSFKMPLALENSREELLKMSNLTIKAVEKIDIERLKLAQSAYTQIQNLFTFPDPWIIQLLFLPLPFFVTIVVIISFFPACAMYRGNEFLNNLELVKPISRFLKYFLYFVVFISAWTLVATYVVMIFSSASHCLHVNVLGDKKNEVLKRVAVVNSRSKLPVFSLGHFLLSTNEAIIENTRFIPPSTNRTYAHFQEKINKWNASMSLILEAAKPLHEQQKSFCKNFSSTFIQANNSTNHTFVWAGREKEIHKSVIKICQVATSCVFDNHLMNLKSATLAALRANKPKQSHPINKRTSNALERFQMLHEKYRMQMWNDYVAPISFLEAPSIFILLCLYMLIKTIMVAISMVETPRDKTTFHDLSEYYRKNQFERGLYWYNI